MRELHLFSGLGGGILGGLLLGHTCVCAVEINKYCRKGLLQRQRDGILPRFPIWDDVTTFDGRPWKGRVDSVCGGFPCTNISIAGLGEGLDGDESKLWGEQRRIIGEVGPDYAFVENSPALTFRGGVRVIADLAALGYDCRWGIMGAEDAIWSLGTPVFDHERKRIWIVAVNNTFGDGRQQAGPWQPASSVEKAYVSEGFRCRERRLSIGTSQKEPIFRECGEATADSSGKRCTEEGQLRPAQSQKWTCSGDSANDPLRHGCGQVEQAQRRGAQGEGAAGEADEPAPSWWSAEPDVDRVVSGIPNRVDRIRAIGMAQVPLMAARAWQTLIP
jgi:DNA (cytosine-5)-methyltransferase 1